MPVSFRAIAKKVGVSVSTVSRALRGDPRISTDTQNRITRIAKQLGYENNPLITAFMTSVRKRSKAYKATIAVLIPFDSQNVLNSHIHSKRALEGARHRAEQLGYVLDEFWTRRDAITPETFHRVTKTRNIYGVLVVTSVGKFSYNIDWQRFASAWIFGSQSYIRPFHATLGSDEHAVGLICQHALSLGFKRIGFASPTGRSANLGFFHAIRGYERGLLPKYRLPPFRAEASKWNWGKFKNWYKRYKPTLIVTRREEIFPFLKEERIKVPENVSLAHFDLYPELESWAGVDQRTESAGAAAVDLVAEQLNNNQRGFSHDSKTVIVKGRWIDGATMGAPPG